MNPTTPLCCKENLWFKHKGGLRARDCKNMCAPALSVSYRKSDFCPCYIRQNVFFGGWGVNFPELASRPLLLGNRKEKLSRPQ